MRDPMESMGPIQMTSLAFPGNRFKGEILPELEKLKKAGIVRIVDMLLVRKDELGNVMVTTASDLDWEEAVSFGTYVGALAGYAAAGPTGIERGAMAGAAELADGHLFDEDDVFRVTQALPKNMSSCSCSSSTCGRSRCSTRLSGPAASSSRTTGSDPRRSSPSCIGHRRPPRRADPQRPSSAARISSSSGKRPTRCFEKTSSPSAITSYWLLAPSTALASIPCSLQDGHETRGPAVVAASDGAVVDFDGHVLTLPEAGSVPVDDRRELEPGRQRAVDAASPAEPRCAERVGDGRVAVPDEQRALQCERQPLDERAAPALPARAGRRARRFRRATAASRRGSAPAASSTSARNASSDSGSRSTARRTSSAFTFPEPSQIELSSALAVEPRQPDSST